MRIEEVELFTYFVEQPAGAVKKLKLLFSYRFAVIEIAFFN